MPSADPEYVDIDFVTFAVRSQKFRIVALVMKRTHIPLATEYATRLTHLVPGIRLDDMLAFFNFEPAEARVLLQDVLGTGLVEERNGQLFLSGRGRDALSPMTDKLDLFEIEGGSQRIRIYRGYLAPKSYQTHFYTDSRYVVVFFHLGGPPMEVPILQQMKSFETILSISISCHLPPSLMAFFRTTQKLLISTKQLQRTLRVMH
jgi:hypothetical protein